MGAFGSYRDGFELLDKAAAKKKKKKKKSIFVVPGATHYDMYDKPDCVNQAVAKLEAGYHENL